MNIGNYVTSIFFPTTGLVVKKWVINERAKDFPHSYQFTIELLENNGHLSILDIHEDDEWKILQ